MEVLVLTVVTSTDVSSDVAIPDIDVYHRAPYFSKVTNFANGAKRKLVEIILTKRHWQYSL